MESAQAQYLVMTHPVTDRIVARWQSYYNKPVTWQGNSWEYQAFIADGITDGLTGGESNITVTAPGTTNIVRTFELAITIGALVELSIYKFNPLFGNEQPQTIQRLVASFAGQVIGGGSLLTTVSIELGTALSPIGAQFPPRKFTTAIMGKGCRL
jgi:hypothetical protein